LLSPFTYIKPQNQQELLAIITENQYKKFRLLAGGTDLFPALRKETIDLDYLVDLSAVGIDQITLDKDNNRLRIGAMVTFAQIISNGHVKRYFPALAQAAESVGAVQTRNLATIGGNICSSVPSCDAAPALLVFGAEAVLCSPHAERRLPIENFFQGPRKTSCRGDEYLSELSLPLPSVGVFSSFLKFGRRKALTLSLVNGAAMLQVVSGEIIACRIALGAVAPTPRRAVKAEIEMQGKRINQAPLLHVGQIAAGEMSPIDDFRASANYRRELSAVLVKRALENCLNCEGGR
jgi:carbon-monoxide dehydrogenase medium subunit